MIAVRSRGIALAAGLVAAACASTPAAQPSIDASAPSARGAIVSEPAEVQRDAAARVAPPVARGFAETDREAAYAQLATDLARRADLGVFRGPLSNWPVTGQVTSPFGPRWGGFHTGLDIAAPMFTPVRAAAAGQVVLAGQPYLAYGDTAEIVMLAHGSDFSTLYVHLDGSRPFPVSVGQRVSAGTVLGYVGVTGWTTGPHVHFMTVSEGRAVDPRAYLP